jgi:hypothetical protein
MALKIPKGVREGLFKVKVLGGGFQGVDYSSRALLGLGPAQLARGNIKGAARAWFSPMRAFARTVVPGLDEATRRLAAKNPDLQLGYTYDLMAGADPSIADEAIRGLGGLVPQTAGGKQIPGAAGLQQVLEYVSGGAYEMFHREMLEQGYLVLFAQNIRKGMAREAAAKAAAEKTNVFFPSIPNWQSAVRSKTGRDFLKFPVFAIGEAEAAFRIPFQAPAEFAGFIGTTVLAAEMLNKLFTGEWLDADRLNPYGEGGYNPKFLRPTLPFKGADGRELRLDILGQLDTTFRFALDPVFAVRTRLGQFPAAGLDIADIQHDEAPMFGEKVESPGDWLKWGVQEASPIAVSALGGTERGRIGLAGAGVQTGGVNISAENIQDRVFRAAEDMGITLNENTWRETARGIPELAKYLEPSETEEAVQELLAPQIEEIRGLGEQLQKGDPVGAALLDAYRDYVGDAVQSTLTLHKDTDFGEPTDEVGRIREELATLRPPRDPETGEEDWFAFDSMRDALIEQMPEVWQQSYAARLRLPEDLHDVERQLKEVSQLRDQLSDIPKYRGINPEDYREYQTFMDGVERWRREESAKRASGSTPEINAAISKYGREQGYVPTSAFMAMIRKIRRYQNAGRLDRQYIDFLVQNEAELSPFYKGLYTQKIRREVARAR